MHCVFTLNMKVNISACLPLMSLGIINFANTFCSISKCVAWNRAHISLEEILDDLPRYITIPSEIEHLSSPSRYVLQYVHQHAIIVQNIHNLFSHNNKSDYKISFNILYKGQRCVDFFMTFFRTKWLPNKKRQEKNPNQLTLKQNIKALLSYENMKENKKQR